MAAFVRPLFAQALEPGDVPVLAVDRERNKLMPMGDGDAVVNTRSVVIDRFLCFAHSNSRKQKDGVAKNDG